MSDTTTWLAILGTAAGCYLLKYAGLSVPEHWLRPPVIQRIAALMPVALLAALVGVQALERDGALHVDARLAGVGAGAVALLLRAPFLVVVVVAAATAAGLRLLTG
jgi:branched-subunit amino acid transport protein